MKVVLANYRYFVSSGPERYLFNVTEHLEGRGHSVVPFSVRYSHNVPSQYERYFVPPIAGSDEVYFREHTSSPRSIARTASRLFYSPEVSRAVSRLVEDTKPDLAYVLYFLRKMSPSLLVGIKRHNLPLVVRISDYGMFCSELHCLRNGEPCTLCVDGSVLPAVRHRCVKGSLPLSIVEATARQFHRARGYFDLVDRFVVTNPFMLEMLVRAGIERSRLVCIPTFTDLDRFAPNGRAHLDPTGPGYFLCIGRLDQPKGVHVLLDALGLLRQRGVDLPMLKLVGGGHDADYVERIEHQIADLALHDHVEMLGHVDSAQIPDLLRGALCTVLPALWFENLPNTLIESMASGTPVIASDIGSLSGEIEDGVNGLLARPGDSGDLADKLATLFGDANLRMRLAAGARKSAAKRYAPDAHIDALLELFGALM